METHEAKLGSKHFCWLHISDFHCGLDSQEWLWPNVRSEFFDDVKRVFEYSGPWDAVFFSGDLTQRGSEEEFGKLTRELEEFWTVFDKLGFRPVLLAVPGNHDLVRPDPAGASAVSLKHWYDESKVRERLWDSGPNDYGTLLDQIFHNYTEWWKGLASATIPTPGLITQGAIPGDFSATVETNELRVGVVGINSAFLQLDDEDYNGRLAVDPRQLCAVTNDDSPRWLKSNDINFLMTHHPPAWLHSTALAEFKSEIFRPGHFLAHICGHLHTSYSVVVAEGGSEARRTFQVPSLFGLRTLRDGSTERAHGYWICKAEYQDGNNGTLQFWPRQMIKAHAGHLKLAPDQRFELNKNGAATERIGPLASVPMTPNQPGMIDSTIRSTQPVPSPNEDTDTRIPSDLIARVVEGSLSSVEAARHLSQVPRLRLDVVPEHTGVRLYEQQAFRTALDESRAAWLAADWGMGKEGFLAATLGPDGHLQRRRVAYRIDCESASNRDQFLAAVRDQSGMSLAELCAALSAEQRACLVLDNIATESDRGIGLRSWLADLEDLTHAILDYCPDANVVLVGRKPPTRSVFRFVELKPLDEPDTRAYIEKHPDGGMELANPRTVERVQRISEGVPMHIDRLLRDLKVLSLDELADHEEAETGENTRAKIDERIPSALVKAIAGLGESTERYSQRSYRLLKVLTVLSQGETFARIKRFDPAEPVYPRNVEELLDRGLVEAITPVESTPIMVGRGGTEIAEYAKRLVVPRQVRDYVRQLLSEKELVEIVGRAAEMYFGEHWREGKVKLPDMNRSSIEQHNIDPRNPHMIIRQLLRDAIRQRDAVGVERAYRVAESYCGQLVAVDLYRVAAEISGDILHVMESWNGSVDLVGLTAKYGRCLRMLDDKDPVPVLRRVTESPPDSISKHHRIEALVDLAFALQHLDAKEEAILAAQEIESLVPRGTANYYDARSIALFCGKVNDESQKELRTIEAEARKKGYEVTADNIALRLAQHSSVREDAIALYRRVLDSKSDSYNQMQASFRLAELVRVAGTPETLKATDRKALTRAYVYAHSQRLTGWFDRCHEALWRFFADERNESALLRLFRHSSFVWRIYGKQEREENYVKELVQAGIASRLGRQEIGTLDREKAYLIVRVRFLPAPVGAN